MGGVIGDVFGIVSPFVSAVGCFAVATTYGGIFWPSPPENDDEANGKTTSGASGFLAPIKVLMPQKYRLDNGKIIRNYGLVFLALGIFFGVVRSSPAHLSATVTLTALSSSPRATPPF